MPEVKLYICEYMINPSYTNFMRGEATRFSLLQERMLSHMFSVSDTGVCISLWPQSLPNLHAFCVPERE